MTEEERRYKTDEEIRRYHFYKFLEEGDLRKALDQSKDMDLDEVWATYNELGTVRDALINTLMGHVVEEYMKAQERINRKAAQESRKRRGPRGGR